MASYAGEFAAEVVRVLRNSGHQALLAGGCVRDLLLGREPADYDVATDATPQQVMNIFPQTFAVGAQFGVVLVPIPGRQIPRQGDEPIGVESAVPVVKHDVVEVATFRCDTSYSDGRHPDAVRYSASAREDVQRRDFTINGLLMNTETGEVLDYVGGRADLEAGIIRTIGDSERRFAEDKLRMLRAVRFAARFDYQIEPKTFKTVQRHADGIHQVSRERIRDELLKMLTEGHARRAFELLDESGLLREVLPEVGQMKGVEQPPQYHPEGDVWTHTLMLLGGLTPNSSRTLGMGALLHDVGKPPTFRVAPDRIRFDGHVEVGVKMAEEICRRYRFSNDDTEQICALVANHMRFADAPRMKPSTLKKFLRLPRFDEHLELHRLDCLASHRDLTLYQFARSRYADTPQEEIRPAPLITGNDLIAAGFVPGPVFREILALVEDLQLDGKLRNKAEAMDFVRHEFSVVTGSDKQ